MSIITSHCEPETDQTRWRQIEDKSPTSLDADVTGIPSSDEEFRSAIVALQKSTDSIERRTDILTSQRNRLRQLSAAEDDSRTRKSSHVHYFNQRETAEVQHVTFAVCDAIRTGTALELN